MIFCAVVFHTIAIINCKKIIMFIVCYIDSLILTLQTIIQFNKSTYNIRLLKWVKLGFNISSTLIFSNGYTIVHTVQHMLDVLHLLQSFLSSLSFCQNAIMVIGPPKWNFHDSKSNNKEEVILLL